MARVSGFRWRLAALAFGGGLALALCAAQPAGAAPRAARCAAVPADGAALVPEGAHGIVGVDVKSLTRSQLYRDHRKTIEQQPGIAEPLAKLLTCGVSLDDLETLTMGVGGENRSVLIVRGKELGTQATLQCLASKIPSQTAAQRVSVARRGCQRHVNRGTKTVAWGLDDHTVVVASESWAGAVGERVAGRGRAATRGNLGSSLAGANRRGTVWFVGSPDSTGRKALTGSAAAQIQSMSGSVDVGTGVRVAVVADAGSRDAATKLRDELDGYLQIGRGMSSLMGVPARVFDGVHLDAAGSRVRATAELSRQDLEDLRRAGEAAKHGRPR